MNRIVVVLVFLLFSGSLLAKPRTNKRPAVTSPATELSQQIASRVAYPAIMREGNYAGIVVITFGVSENNRLSRLTVHTANQELNDDLTRQLVGQKIRLADSNPFETYTVRLHFTK
ncbi:MAG: hypothetical protein LH609_16760 [Rudanella sp.]|nr:hypothetical protein [Rudanella sp.]